MHTCILYIEYYIFITYTLYTAVEVEEDKRRTCQCSSIRRQVLLSLSPYSLATEYHLCIFAYMKYARFMIWIDWNTSEKIWACYNRRPVGPMQWPLPRCCCSALDEQLWDFFEGFTGWFNLYMYLVICEDWYKVFFPQTYFASGLPTFLEAFNSHSTATLLTCRLKMPKKESAKNMQRWCGMCVVLTK